MQLNTGMATYYRCHVHVDGMWHAHTRQVAVGVDVEPLPYIEHSAPPIPHTINF
jgi:hypothetical protein